MKMEKASSDKIFDTPEKHNKYSNALNFYKNLYKILLWFIYKIIIGSTTNPYNFWESMETSLN